MELEKSLFRVSERILIFRYTLACTKLTALLCLLASSIYFSLTNYYFVIKSWILFDSFIYWNQILLGLKSRNCR